MTQISIVGPLCSSLTDCGLGVVARNIMELDTVVVEVVEYGQAELVTFAVVWLPTVGAEKKTATHLWCILML